MSLITYNELCEEVKNGLIRVPPNNPAPYDTIPLSHINGASVDVRLGSIFLCESTPKSRHECDVNLNLKQAPDVYPVVVDIDKTFSLSPGQFILAHTLEEFYLPYNIAAEFRLKSSVARAGLDQALAVWCDPGWQGSVLTMELRNNNRWHTLLLTPGMKIGQMVFFKGEPVPHEASYTVRGQYNNDKEATQSKGVK